MQDAVTISPEEREYPKPTRIDTVKDLADFLNTKLEKYPSYANNELHAEYSPDNYRLVVTAKVTDDQFILVLDVAESEPFNCEDDV